METDYSCFLVSATLTLIISEFNSSYGLEFSNHTSERCRIQFQYPRNCEIIEKTNRFDESSDIRVSNPLEVTMIAISFSQEPVLPGTFRKSVNEFFDAFTIYDFTKEQKVIEKPTFLTIDGNQAFLPTFLFMSKDKYDESAKPVGEQVWLVNNVDHNYVISFLASTASFDSPENIQIRDQFIKSINFLGSNNQTRNITN